MNSTFFALRYCLISLAGVAAVWASSRPLHGQPSSTNVIRGAISVAGERDVFTFSLTNRGRYYFDSLSNASLLNWHLSGPIGIIVTNRGFNIADGINTPVSVLALPPGPYTLSVDADTSSTNGYAFRFVNLATATLLTPNTVVSNRLSPGNETDLYQFVAEAETPFRFDRLALDSGLNVYWRLIDPYGAEVFANNFADVTMLTLGPAGTYTLLVEGHVNNTGSGSYSFILVPQGPAQPPVFTGAPLALNTVVSSNLSVAVPTNNFIFTLASETRLSFDAQTNNANLRWTLRGPPGVLFSQVTFPSTGWAVSNAPAGDYQLSISASVGLPAPYRFQLLDLAAAQAIIPGNVISDTLTPANASKAYRFTVAAGQRFYFDALDDAGFAWFSNPFWILLGPLGNEIFDQGFADVAARALTVSGDYTLIVGGGTQEPEASASYSFNLRPVNDGVQAMTLNTIVNGAISGPGQRQSHAFTVSAATRLSFDSLSNVSALRWTIEGPTGVLFNNLQFVSSGWHLFDAPAGEYTVTVSGTGDNTGGYRFQVLDLATANTFTPGSIVDGVVSPANATTVYRFRGAAGQRLYFDTLNDTGFDWFSNPFWRLIDPYGDDVFNQAFTDVAAQTLTADGPYTLLVGGAVQEVATSGTFSFNFRPVTNTTQALALNTPVAGRLVGPGQRQIYTFTLPTGTRLSFDSQTDNSDLRWSLNGPTGPLFGVPNGIPFHNTGWHISEAPAGNYTLTVFASEDSTGSYRFQILDLAAGSPITLDIAVNGTNTPANGTLVYRFSAAAGQRLFFDALADTGFDWFNDPFWTLRDPAGAEVFAQSFTDIAAQTLIVSGIYTLLVGGLSQEPNPSGTFSFMIRTVNDVAQPLPLNVSVAGAISGPGQRQHYTFTLASATRMSFDTQVNDVNLRWTLSGPTGVSHNNLGFNSGGWFIFEAAPGDYTLTVAASGDATGPYRFQLLDFSAATLITPGLTNSGTVMPANATLAYRLNVTAGDRLIFDALTDAGFIWASNPYWTLIDPYGMEVFDQQFDDVAERTNTVAGTYTLLVGGHILEPEASGSFSFVVRRPGISTPPAFTGTPLIIGATISSNLPTATATNIYIFTLAAPTRLFFDGLVNSGVAWWLEGPPGLLVNNRAFFDSDGVDRADSSVRCPAGNYRLTVNGQAGAYAFRLLDAATALAFTPGNVVTGLVANTKSTILYRFNASAGDRFYFDARPATGFSHAPYMKIHAPFGNIVLNQGVTTDEETFTALQTGTYLASVEGRFADTGTNGTFSFVLQPVTDGIDTFVVGETVNSVITHAGQRQFHHFNLASSGRLFFDSWTGSTLLNWTLTGPPGMIVNSRPFYDSDSLERDAALNLPAGDYVIMVDATGDETLSYAFRLVDTSSAVSFTPGVLVTNSLAPGISTTLYRFNAAAGDRFYFDGRPRSGFTHDPYVRLYGPLGDVLLTLAVTSDEDVFTVAQTGTYLLSVEGRFADTSAMGNFSFLLQPVLDGTNTFAIGQTVNGAITHAGQRQFHYFSLASAARLFFDSLVNSSFTWTLAGPSIEIFTPRPFHGSDGLDGDARLNLPAGDFVITVDTSGTNTGSYAFRLLDAATALAFTPGVLVTNSLAPGNSTALYRFNATAGERFYFDGRLRTGFTHDPYVHLYSPLDALLLTLAVTADEDTFAVPQTGTYLLAVEGRFADTSTSGNFSFLLTPNLPQAPTPLFDTNQAPDLTVTTVSLTPPSGLQSGQSATVQWTLRNDGTASTIGVFTDRVTVRNTATSQILVNRTLLYDESAAGSIPPSGTRARQLTVMLPDGPASVGTLAATVTTDALNNVFEQNGGGTAEANNARSINIVTTLAPYPDLQVTSLNAFPSAGWLTRSVVTVSWVITNTGNRATTGSWNESLLIRNTNTAVVIVNTTTNYDDSAPGNGPIAPNGSRSRSLSFAMPQSVNAYGAFEIVVSTDSENFLFEHNAANTAENNNSRSLISASAPDLAVNELAVTGNSSLQAGAELIIRWNTANNGNVAATEFFYDRVLVRNTNTSEVLLNTSLPYNPSQGTNTAIPSGGSRAREYAFDLPDGARSVGRLEITVTADAFNHLAEHNASGTGEANNGAQVQVTVADRPYPDLIVTSVSGPASGLPGQSVAMVWTIRNQGTVPAIGPWSDHLFLSADPVIGGDQFLASVQFNGVLNAGISLTRTQQVTLPSFSTGARYFVAETDAGSDVFEENEANNAGISSAIALQASLSLALSPVTVSENAGAQASLATVTRNSSAAGSLLVTLASSQPSKVIVPPNVTIPVGANSAGFYVGVVDDTLVVGDVVATLTAQAAGHRAATNTLSVRENDSPRLTLQLSAPSVVEDAASGAVTGRVTRNVNTNTALAVTLTSSRPAALAVPASVTIPAGQTNAPFNLDPVDDDLVTGSRVAAVHASAAGFGSVSAPINVLDDDTVALTLQLSDTNVSETAVSPAAIATVTRSPVSSALLRVRLSTNGGGLVQVPAEVIIPASQPAVTFNVNVRDDNLAFGAQTVSIIGVAEAQDGTPIAGGSANAVLTIRDNDGPTLFVSTEVAVIEEGGSTVVTITRNTPPTNSLAIALSAAPAGQGNLPASVVIASGQSSTNVTITGVADGIGDGATEVAITASAAGFNPGSAPVTITDIDVPDLAVIEVSAPTNGLTDATISVVWTATNSGLSTASGMWVDEVYLATDAQGANAVLMTSVSNGLPVTVGDSYTLSRSIPLPSDPGNYWLLIRTDAGHAIPEGSERNNAALSAAITVQPSYRATVSTDLDAAVSGTPVELNGRTFFSSDGSPAPFRVASVRINVNRTRRTLQVISDSQGNFETIFQPIPGEAGVYTIGADHPRVRQDPVQDQFTLLGMGAVPWELSLRLAPNVMTTGQIELRNLSPLPLNGVTVTPEGLPLDFSVTAIVTNMLGGRQTNYIRYEIVTSLTTPVQGRFGLRVSSSEGAQLSLPVDFIVAPPTAQLLAQPASLERGMLRGAQTLVSFEVVNQGGVASGDLAVALPVVPWLSLISTSPIPSLPPDGRTTLLLALSPPADLPLTRYDGTLALIGVDTSLTVPFHFRALSEARGDVLLTVTDEHTYYASGAPKVTNALIELRDPITSDVVANGTSDANGEVRFTNLMEGGYIIEASAPGHSHTRGGVRVAPGVTSEQEVFLLRQEVTYEWRVVPTVIQDHYRVVLRPLFETEVPQPNLVVENPDITAIVVPGFTSQFAIRLRNTGLISLLRTRIPVPNHPNFIITPLVNEIEEIPARTTITVPVTIRVRDSQGGGAGELQPAGMGGGCPGDDCVIQLPIDTRFRCGKTLVVKDAAVSLHAVCVTNTGCDFTGFLDTSSPSFYDESALANRAEFDCMLGKMDECDKARIRGFLKSGDFGSVFFPSNAVPFPLSATNFGLSAFCVCGPAARTNTIFMFGTNLLNQLGFPVGGGTVGFNFVGFELPGPCNAHFAPAGLSPASLIPASPGQGVCARVRLEISQDIMMTRAAFRGTLVLDNNGATALTGIQLALDFRDGTSQPAGNLFSIRGPILSGVTAIDGNGMLAAGSSGSVEYTFVPTLDAAPTGPRSYYIGGTLRFTLEGEQLTIPLMPAEITVLPDARLQLEYFQQRDVYSDDPFTDELEPAEPFALGLRIKNAGAGSARSFQIASAAPRIIENEKGLLIDFQLLGARLGNAPLTPSFNLNVGDIDPGQSKIVIWDMTSTLQGKFIDYQASFQHLDAFGATNISLIEGVNVHEMIHVVLADRAGDDSLPDFLANDAPDPDNLPDIVYLSNGSTGTVSLASNPVIDSPPTTNDLQVQLTVAMPPGFSYLRMTNPGPDLRLMSVRRSDGKQLLMGDNVWTTDRSFPSALAGAIREKLLHLFDHNSTGSYTLSFARMAQDTNPPTSTIAPLSGTSAAGFAVEWSGEDGPEGSGIAYFDIYVSVNGGPFTNWLARTTLRSAIFSGAAGDNYAFYSVATDVEGNQELAPASPDTLTSTTGGANTAPTIVPIADVTLNEGGTLALLPTVIDIDTPRQTLAFSAPVAPAGATVDAVNGAIQWVTGEAQGGTTNRFTLLVTDNGLPSLSATQAFSVVVREVNNAPFFVNPVLQVEVDEEATLTYPVEATDADVPANQLMWQLGLGAPSGVAINPLTGLLTWIPDELRGPGEYPVTITVRDNGVPAETVTRTLRIIVREANRPPTLAAIPAQAALVQTTLSVTNSASDPDVPAQSFFFSLAPGAPRGAHIDRVSGVFSWTPARQFALTTNFITVRVTDNGVPSLTAEQAFTVIVGDYLEVNLGSDIVVAGQTGSVPLVVYTTVPVTNVSFTFEATLDRLTNFTLPPPTPPLAAATLQPIGNNRYQVQLRTLSGMNLAGEQIVSQLRFMSLSNRLSAFVPLLTSGVAAEQSNGQPVPRALGNNGRVAYLGAEPLLELQSGHPQLRLHLYGRPPGRYIIQSTPSLHPPIDWDVFWQGTPAGLIEVFSVSATNRALFFRAERP